MYIKLNMHSYWGLQGKCITTWITPAFSADICTLPHNNESLDFHQGHPFTSLFSSGWHFVGCLCYDQWFYSWKFILLRNSSKKIKMHVRGSSLVDWLFAKIWFPFFCGRIILLCHLNSGKPRWLVWIKNVNRLHVSLSGRRFKPCVSCHPPFPLCHTVLLIADNGNSSSLALGVGMTEGRAPADQGWKRIMLVLFSS